MFPKTSKQLTATTSTSKTAMAQTIVDNRMRYAKKSPEEQKSAKLSQVACLNKDTCSSGTDANADLPGGDNPAAPEPKQEKKKEKVPQETTADVGGGAHGAQGDVARL